MAPRHFSGLTINRNTFAPTFAILSLFTSQQLLSYLLKYFVNNTPSFGKDASDDALFSCNRIGEDDAITADAKPMIIL